MASRGRPATGAKMTERIGICVTAELKAALGAVAEKEERSFSSMCSIIFEEWLRSHKSSYPEAIELLNKQES